MLVALGDIDAVIEWFVAIDAWIIFAILNVLMFVGWMLTIRRAKEMTEMYRGATWWWRWWVEQAVKNGYEPAEDEKTAAEELCPGPPVTVDGQLQAIRESADASDD